ncbi:MAG: DUF3616 domain-containing protein [Candidatus Accumulibacter sp.]|nr:DUF3616 domain-containing protein [Accumulibacter sp.]
MHPENTPGFRTFTGVHEPSGIRQLADGRFVVVEDEERQPLSLLTIDGAGRVRAKPLSPPRLPSADADFWRLDDLEGVAVDHAGYVYAITSHSRSSAGEVEACREKLLRFRIDGNRAVEPRLITGLKPALTAAHPLLAAAAEIREVKTRGGLNIEALEMSPDQESLLLGFRSPLLDQRAIIACIENPQAIFEAGEQPRIGERLLTLDLGGNGIRGIGHVPLLGGYLVLAGPMAREDGQFQLWFWSSDADAAARRVHVAGLSGFEHAEGVTAALIDGRQRLIIVSDDGSQAKERFARFLIVDLEQLQIDP